MLLRVPALWHDSPNFGDALTPWLIKKITGLDAVWTNNTNFSKYMITGSILNDPGVESCIVWGAGIAHRDTYIRKPLEIRAVRGPLTRRAVQNSGVLCPEVYGDPCLLLPRFYRGTPLPKTYKLGIIPHIIDLETVINKYDNTVLVINLNDSIESVINQVLSCEVLVSSSLHGIIVSHAYGKPCGWVKYSDNILGDGVKFQDYYHSIGKPEIEQPLDLITSNPTPEELIEWIPKDTTLNINLDKLYNVCPLIG